MRLQWLAVLFLGLGGCPNDAQTPRRGTQVRRVRPAPPRRTPPPQPWFADARQYLLTGDTDSGRTADFSPDGRLLAVGGTFGRIHLVDLRTGKTLRILQTDDELDRPIHVRFTPTGDHLLAAGYDACALKVWHVETGKVVRSIPLGRAVHGLELTSGANVAVAATGWAKVVSWRTGRETHRVVMPYGLEARHLALNASGTHLAVSSSVGHLRLVDVARREDLAQRRIDSARVTSLALHPTGRLVAVGLANGAIQLLEGATLKRRRAFDWSSVSSAVVGLRFSTGGRRLMALSAQGRLFEVLTATGRILSSRAVTGSPTTSLSLSSDGLLAVAPRKDHRLAIWQSSRHKRRIGLPHKATPRPAGPPATLALPAPQQLLLSVASGRIVSLALSGNGTRLVLGHHPPALSAWTLRTRRANRFVRLWRRKVVPPRGANPLRGLRVALSPKERFVYLHGPTDRLRRYTMAGGWPVAMRPTTARGLRSLLPTPDGKTWITTTATEKVHLWSPLGVRRSSFGALKSPYWVGVSPDSQRFVEVGGVDELAVYDLRTKNRLWRHPGHLHRILEVMALRFSPDSKRLLTYHRSGFLRIVNATTGRRVDHRRIATPPGIVSCALRPDTRVLACAVGPVVRFYEVATGALIRVVRPKSTVTAVLGLGYSADGSTLIVLETQRQLRLLKFPLTR